MEIKQIEIFLKVAEHKSFTKAAEELYITQQAVSKRIAELEAELGVVLFDRNTKQVELTEVGAFAYYKLFRNMAMLNKTVAELKEFSAKTKPLIKVGIYAGIRRKITTEVMPKIYQIVPKNLVDITIVSHVGSFQLIDNGKIDLFFTFIDAKERWGDFGSFILDETSAKIIVPKNHRWNQLQKVSEQHLKREIFVRFPLYPGTIEHSVYNDMPCCEVREKDGMTNLLYDVESQGGFTVLPEDEEMIQQFQLSCLEPPFECQNYKISGMYDRDNENPILKKILKLDW